MTILYTCVSGDLYVDDDGYIKIKEHNPRGIPEHDALENLFIECGYKKFTPCTSVDIAYEHVGESIEEFKAYLMKRAKRNKYYRGKSNESFKRWVNQCDKYSTSDYLIGVDRQIDNFETGFRVFVLMNSRLSRKQQADFIRRKKNSFIAFVVDEIKHFKKRKYADLLPFCRISEITVTNRNEAVVTFELKEKLQKVLDGVADGEISD